DDRDDEIDNGKTRAPFLHDRSHPAPALRLVTPLIGLTPVVRLYPPVLLAHGGVTGAKTGPNPYFVEMSEYLRFGTLAFTSLLAILNPLSAVPMYVALTARYDRAKRTNTLRRAIFTAFMVMIIFTFAGRYILRFFGITTHAFQITGGIIFFSIGWEMLQARRSRTKT